MRAISEKRAELILTEDIQSLAALISENPLDNVRRLSIESRLVGSIGACLRVLGLPGDGYEVNYLVHRKLGKTIGPVSSRLTAEPQSSELNQTVFEFFDRGNSNGG